MPDFAEYDSRPFAEAEVEEEGRVVRGRSDVPGGE